jgi:hypothetical protein
MALRVRSVQPPAARLTCGERSLAAMVTDVFAHRVVVPEHVMIRVLQGESVVLNLETEWYVGLDEVGTRMWEVLTTEADVEAAAKRLLDEYDVDEPRLRADLTQFIAELTSRNLVELQVGRSA